MESLNTDNLMRLQVEQPEKEKKELNEKVLVLAKRLDHIERAYCKEERPLLAKTTRSSRRTTARCSRRRRRPDWRTTGRHTSRTSRRRSV